MQPFHFEPLHIYIYIHYSTWNFLSLSRITKPSMQPEGIFPYIEQAQDWTLPQAI